jgi:hypothetical protein
MWALFFRPAGIVPGTSIGIAVHRSSFSFLGRSRPAIAVPAFASSENLIQAEKAEDQKGDERDAEEKYIPTGPGRVRVHCDLLSRQCRVYGGFGETHKGSRHRNKQEAQDKFNFFIQVGPVGLPSPSFVDLI